MPHYANVNGIEIVDSLLAKINYPYYPEHYSFALWADEIGFKKIYLHTKEHIVSADVCHRYDKTALMGKIVASIEINQFRKTCSVRADISEFNNMLPRDFVKYLCLEISSLGTPAQMEGEKLIAT